MSLGLKETVSQELKRIQSNLIGTDEKTKGLRGELKSINKDLKKKTLSEYSTALAELSRYLKTTRSNAMGLSAILKSVSGEDLSRLFSGNINANNAKKYLDIIKKIKDALGEVGKNNSVNTDKLFASLNRSAQYVANIVSIKDSIKNLQGTLDTPAGKEHEESIRALIKNYRDLRTTMLSAVNNGTWNKKPGEEAGREHSELLRRQVQLYNDIRSASVRAADDITASSTKVVQAQQAQEQQAKKTTEALEQQAQAEKKLAESKEKASAAVLATKGTVSVNATGQETAVASSIDKTISKTKELGDVAERANSALNRIFYQFQGKDAGSLSIQEAAERTGRYVYQLIDLNNRLYKEQKKALSSENGESASQFGLIRNSISNAIAYLEIIQRISVEQKKIESIKVNNPNVDTAKLREANNLLVKYYNELLKLQDSKTGVDNAFVVGDFSRVLRMTLRDVHAITSEFSKKDPFSAFSGNVAKIESEISRVGKEYDKFRRLVEEGASKGYKTSMLGDSFVELERLLARLNAAKGNKSFLTDAAQMKNLVSDVAVELSRASRATAAYGYEKGKVIAVNRELALAEKLTSKENEQELKAQSDYIKRYMALLEERRSLMQKAGIEPFEKNDQGLKNIRAEIDRSLESLRKLREDMALYNQAIASGDKEQKDFGRQGMKEAGEQAERLMRSITALEDVYQTLRGSRANVKDLLGQTFDAQRNGDELKRMGEYYKNLERTSSEASKKMDANERQRQREITNTGRRYDSLGNILRKLRREFSTGIAVGADTSKTEAEIRRVIGLMRELADISSRLKSGDWESSLGRLGNIGSGHDTTLANRVVQDQAALNREQRRVNSEKQKSIDLERKHQEEIAKTAAKVRNDLVKGLEQANSHAGKLNSTVQDLKSLFLQGGLVFGAQQFAMSIITTGGEMEKQHIALQSILGDIQNANTIFGQLKDLALNSPFTFSELNRDVKQLAAYGVEYDQLYDTTKRLADMSSGLGVSFDRIALAFGQVQARGWLDGKELRQIAYAGIPLLDKLSEYYSKREGRKVSTSEIKTRISKRDVSFDDVKNIFWEMTDAGGQFYNMQQTLSETLLGRYNKLKDAWEIMLADFASGDSLAGKFFKTAIEGVTALVQSMHTLALPVGTVFAGYAMKRMLGGNTGSSYLKNKSSVAADIQKKVVRGEELSAIEARILATRNRITGTDLRQLAISGQLTRADLNRLRVSGHISAKQYEIYRALLLQQSATTGVVSRWAVFRRYLRMNGISGTFRNIWASFSTSALASFGLIKTGIKSIGATLWSAIGGLPGLILTAFTFGITYAISKWQELSQQMKQTQDEINDRIKQINDFRKETNASSILSTGDSKEINNTIDEYKKKLEELAPYCYLNIVRTAESKKDQKEALRYLDDEMEKLKEAQNLAAKALDKRTVYDGLKNSTETAYNIYKDIESDMASGSDSSADEGYYKFNIGILHERIKSVFGDISKSEDLRMAAMQAMSNIFSALEIPEDKANILRVSLLESFGVGDTDPWLQTEVGNEMRSLIDKVYPDIAAKIESGQNLNDAEKKKVYELMDDAKRNLEKKYPETEATLQRLLAQSNFEAVIHLVVGDNEISEFQQRVLGNLWTGAGAESPNTKDWKKRADMQRELKPLLKDVNDMYSARNAVKTELELRYNKMKATNDAVKKGKLSKTYADEATRKYQDLWNAAFEGLGYSYIPEDKKSNKVPKTKTHQEDEGLKNLRTRIDLYKKLYQEIKKTEDLYGKNGALDKLRADGEFKSIFNDKKLYPISEYSNYETSIKSLLGTLQMTTKERRDYRDDQMAGIYTENRKNDEDAIKNENDALSKRLDILGEQYEVYKKMYELTGNSKGSMKIAFGGSVESDSMLKYLKSEIENYLPVANKRSNTNLTVDDVMDLDEENLKDKFGKDSALISVLISRLKNEQNKVRKETIDLLAETIEKNATIEQQIDDENRKYERQKELVNGILDPQMRQRASEGIEKTHNENSAKLKFEQFKQTSNWVTIFDDLDRVSSATINSMIKKVDKFSKTTGLSVEAVKQLRDALGKLRDKSIERNPMDAITNSTSRGNAIGEIIKSSFDPKLMPAGGKTVLTEEQAKKTGLIAGKAYKKEDLENEQQSAYADFGKGLSSLTAKFKALQDILSPVTELFSTLGMEDNALSEGLNIGSNALGAATQANAGLSSLGLEAAGPYGAAASAALSVVSGLFAMHDKALQKEIEASEARQKEMENMTKNIKSIIEATLGGIYNYTIDSDTEKTLNKVTDDYESVRAYNAKIDEQLSKRNSEVPELAYRMVHQQSKYSDETYKAAKEAQSKPDSAYHAELASLMAQRDEIKNQRNAEDDKKKKDKDKVADYDQQIKEMEQQINTFAQDFLKEIYSIDFKSWASELTDAVVSAWENGEDAVDAYKEKVRDMIKDVTKNIISQKIMESYMAKPLKFLTETLKDKGKLNEDDMLKLANELYDGADGATTTIIDTLNMLKEKGLDLRGNSSSSTTNSVKGITEETADILASYVNQIRADVSVNRENIKIIAEAVGNLPAANLIAKSQLAALNQLVSLAQDRNGMLDDMYTWMKSVSNGTKKISVA